eukprot:12756498-Alexandrium_andersonii.AAC.1
MRPRRQANVVTDNVLFGLLSYAVPCSSGGHGLDNIARHISSRSGPASSTVHMNGQGVVEMAS